jgi:sigma-B regulation protein RsbU (phosphoserine phosphatase)
MASRVQWALLPEENLCFADWEVHYRYLPVGLVSGDYCDAVACKESGVLHFMLGDVSGKGVSAAFFMARLSALFRTLVGEGLPVEGLVSRANDLFAGSTLASQYATLVYGRAYTDGRVELCNAGHCRPILLHGGESTCLESTGIPVGLFAGHPYQVKTVDLKPGDTLLLYTDGITEALNPQGEEYGEDRICRILREQGTPACCGLAKSLLSDLDAFTSGVPRKDDLTVMVIRRDYSC